MVKDFLAIKAISELDNYFFFEHIGKKEFALNLVQNNKKNENPGVF